MKFCFIAPYYSEQSNGIRVLYEAAYQFSKVVDCCSIKIYDPIKNQVLSNPNIDKIPTKYKKLINFNVRLTEDFIYILPETPSILPINFNKNFKVVRYLLANPYFFNDQLFSFKDNFLLSYSDLISKKLPQFFVEALPDLKIKRSHKTKNKKALIYFGKFRLAHGIFSYLKFLNNFLESYQEIEIMHRGYPSRHKKYVKMLSQADLLICYDPMSSVTHEASLMGIPTIIIDPLNHKRSFNIKLQYIYYIDDLVKYNQINIKSDDLKKGTIKHYNNQTIASKSKETLKKNINLIDRYFSEIKFKNKLDNLFKQELANLKKDSKVNFKYGIISFNSPIKMFLLILFFSYNKDYLVIQSLFKRKNFNKFFKILYYMFYLIRVMRFRFFVVLFKFLNLLILYKFSKRKFICHFNELIGQS